jgi:hypothetical protein
MLSPLRFIVFIAPEREFQRYEGAYQVERNGCAIEYTRPSLIRLTIVPSASLTQASSVQVK